MHINTSKEKTQTLPSLVLEQIIHQSFNRNGGRFDDSTRIDHRMCTSSHWQDITSSYRIYIPLSAKDAMQKQSPNSIQDQRRFPMRRTEERTKLKEESILLLWEELRLNQSLFRGEKMDWSHPIGAENHQQSPIDGRGWVKGEEVEELSNPLSLL